MRPKRISSAWQKSEATEMPTLGALGTLFNPGLRDQGTLSPTLSRVPAMTGAGPISMTELEHGARLAAQKFVSAAHWIDADRATVNSIGGPAFGAGVVAGIVKNVAVSIAELGKLIMMLYLADYYTQHHSTSSLERSLSSSTVVFASLIDNIAQVLPGFEQMSKDAYLEREQLIGAIKSIFTNPGKTFEAFTKAASEKYDAYTKLESDHTLSGQFQAGVIFGEVLFDLVLFIDGVTAVARLATKIPSALRTLSELGEVVRSTKSVALVADESAQVAAKTRQAADLAEVAKPTGEAKAIEPGITEKAKTAPSKSTPASAHEPRGLSKHGGIFNETVNEAGGTVYTSNGAVSQNDFAGYVNSELMKGKNVNIISGVHGDVNGAVIIDRQMYLDDVAAFGEIPGVTVHDFSSLSSEQLNALLNGADTTIGGFCNSGICLAPNF